MGGLDTRCLCRLNAGQSGQVASGGPGFHIIYHAHVFFYFRCFQVSKHLLSTYYVQGMFWVLGGADVGNRSE